MTNPPRKKGTSAETAAVRWLRANGYPHADRQPLRGNRDTGDLDLTAGLIAEVKAYRGPAGAGQAPAALLTRWLHQAETERLNASADHCPLIVKRTGTTDPARWWAYLPLRDLTALLGSQTAAPYDPLRWVCMTLDSLTVLLRTAGYGQAPDPQEA